MIVKPDSETLMAYADGRLGTAARAEVDAALAEFPDLQDEVRLYEQSLQLMRDALAPKLHEPVPAYLEDLVLKAPSQIPSIAPLDRARQRKRNGFEPGWLQAVAACVVVAGAAAAGFAGGRSGQPSQSIILAGPVDERGWLSRALSETASGETQTHGGASLTAVASYLGSDGQVCREVELSQGGYVSGVMACRSGSEWEIQMAANLGPETTGAGFQPASGGSADALYIVLDEISAGDALSPSDEKCLSMNDWNPEIPCAAAESP